MLQKYKKIYWTGHSEVKIRQYGLSKSKLLQMIYKPERKEKGIVAGTTAVMQTRKVFSKRQVPPGEMWLMYKDVKDVRKIISAWRYPGISKPGEPIPVPQDILQEILNEDVYK